MRIGMQVLSSLLLLLFSSSLGLAEGRATLRGRISDESGAAVSGATVTLRRSAVGFERVIKADVDGIYIFEGLLAGQYQMSVQADGFAIAERQVELTSSESVLDLQLRPGSFTEDVTIVTARLAPTPESVQRIPGTVDIVDTPILEVSRVFNFNEALRKVAGLTLRDEEGFGLRPNIGIRGLNPTRSTKVLLLEDGVPLTYSVYGDNASYYHPPVERFSSIEVLKGSGQIIHGPVTVGGVINYITPQPPSKPGGVLTLVGGNRDYFNGHFGYGGTWGNTGLIFDYMRKQGEGSRVNIRHGINDLNLKLVTAFNSRNVLTLKTNYYGERSRVTYSGLTQAEYDENPRQNPFRNDSFEINRFGAMGNHTLLINNDFVMSTNVYFAGFFRDWWRQSSNSLQRPNDAADPNCGGMANLNTTCGNEGRLRKYYTVGIDPRFRLSHNLFGIKNEADFGFRAHFEVQDRRQLNGNTPLARTGVTVEDNERRNQAYSGFIQNRFILGGLTITPGLRVEKINYKRTNRLANGGAGVSGKTDLTQLVPGLGVSYSFGDKATIFSGVHRGFAPPRTEDIINNTTGGVVDLDPEQSWNYEVGVRSTPMQGIRLNVSYFRTDFSNQIVPASIAGGQGATLTNGGETLHQGLELNSRVDTGTLFNSPHNFYLRLNYAYVRDAKFTGQRFSNIPGFSSVSVTGNRLPYSPEHLLTAGFGYSHRSGLDILVESNYLSDQFADDLNTVKPSPDGQRGLIPAYTIWNATVNYKVEAIHSTFFFTVKNLLNDTFIVDRARGILPTPPRLVQTGIKFNF